MKDSERQEKIRRIQEIMQKCITDPNLPEKMEEYQRKYGTLSEEDLKKTFTI